MAYETPSVPVFRNRRRFHETQKSINESISDWFKRLQVLTKKCGYKRISDYMFIDKFLSGLSDTDFEKISQVPIWTVEELVLVVIGNAHIFKRIKPQNSRESKEDSQGGTSSDELNKTYRQCADEIQQIKVEDAAEIDDVHCELGGYFDDTLKEDDVHCELGGYFDDTLKEESINQLTEMTNEASKDSEGAFPMKKIPLTPTERKQNFIQRLKLKGEYENYKRVQAEKERQRRLNAKHNEQYLPSELQLHIINERRRANRERVRFREPKKRGKSVTVPQYLAETNIAFVEPKCESEDATELDPMRGSMMEGPEFDPERKMQPKTKRLTKRRRANEKKAQSNLLYAAKKSYECYLCSLSCSNMHEVRTHFNIFHRLEERIHKCSFCSTTSRSREVLSKHMRKVHGEYRVLKCPCCDALFRKRTDRNTHVTKMHRDYRPYICETCGKSYKTIGDLRYHANLHASQEVYKCEICDQTLGSRKSYRSHMSRHTSGKRYSCGSCDKTFRNTSHLSKHLIGVHGQGEKPYACEICAKRFLSKYHLKLHFNSHTGRRPFQCDACESTFTQPSSLKLHIRNIHQKNV